jgi:hypothetical protein
MNTLEATTTKTDGATKFARWQDFALRMARTCYAKRTNPSLSEIESEIQSFFEYYVSQEYADLYIDWDCSKNFPGRSDGPGYVCDMVSSLFESVWSHPTAHATKRQLPLLDYYWERGEFDEYDEIKEAIVDRWESPVSCCLRSGMDFAYSQSAGVLGFTAADLRAMYPEGVPGWITAGWTIDFDLIPDGASLLF